MGKLNLRRRRQGLKGVQWQEQSFHGVKVGGRTDEKLLRQDYLINFPDEMGNFRQPDFLIAANSPFSAISRSGRDIES